MNTETAPRFDLQVQSEAIAFDKHLLAEGYAVVANAADLEQINISKSLFWNWMERTPTSTQISRHHPTTWNSTKEHPWLPNSVNGIISNIGHSDFCWSLRTLPVVKQAFQRIWNTSSEMIVSFDAANAFRPWRRNPSEWLTEGGVSMTLVCWYPQLCSLFSLCTHLCSLIPIPIPIPNTCTPPNSGGTWIKMVPYPTIQENSAFKGWYRCTMPQWQPVVCVSSRVHTIALQKSATDRRFAMEITLQ